MLKLPAEENKLQRCQMFVRFKSRGILILLLRKKKNKNFVEAVRQNGDREINVKQGVNVYFVRTPNVKQ